MPRQCSNTGFHHLFCPSRTYKQQSWEVDVGDSMRQSNPRPGGDGANRVSTAVEPPLHREPMLIIDPPSTQWRLLTVVLGGFGNLVLHCVWRSTILERATLKGLDHSELQSMQGFRPQALSNAGVLMHCA
jgi:hypothetical protein